MLSRMLQRSINLWQGRRCRVKIAEHSDANCVAHDSILNDWGAGILRLPQWSGLARVRPRRLYYAFMTAPAKAVAAFIRKHDLLKAGDRVGIAVSGGLDSVALLRLALELRDEIGIVLSVVHFNHKLRGADADADEEFVADLAREYGLECYCDGGDVAAHATNKHLSLETAARELRYSYFRRLLRETSLGRIATAHTIDDQAETVLLRVVRGAGTRGLAGIYPKLSVPCSARGHDCAIIRPLLCVTRAELQSYLQNAGQRWREDASNLDLRHARNRVRQRILPQLEQELNPAVRERLAEAAEIARAEEEFWEREVAQVLPSFWAGGGRSGRLDLRFISELPLAMKRRVIRAVAEALGLRLEFRRVEDVLGIASGDARYGKVELPGGWVVSRQKGELSFDLDQELETFPEERRTEAGQTVRQASGQAIDYEHSLRLPGSVYVPQLARRFETVILPRDAAAGYNPDHLIDAGLLRGELRIRNWRAGDRFFPAHTKSPKKVKELLQGLHVSGMERKLWPVVTCGAEIVWVRGFPAPAHLQFCLEGSAAVVIRECEPGATRL